MESRLEQMGKIATTADVLEAQQKEQKVMTQFQFDSFSQKLHLYFHFNSIGFPCRVTPIQIPC